MAEQTLESMYRGGLFDHVGGGFARYSTDEMWLVPHFEKMLYDNALLALAYTEAYQQTRRPLYGRSSAARWITSCGSCVIFRADSTADRTRTARARRGNTMYSPQAS